MVSIDEEIMHYVNINTPFIFLEGYSTNLPSIINSLRKTELFEKVYYTDVLTELTTLPSEPQLMKYESIIDAISRKILGRNLIVIEGLDGLINNAESTYHLIDALYKIALELTSQQKEVNQSTIIFSGNSYQIPSILRDYSVVLSKVLPNDDGIQEIITSFVEYHIPEKNWAENHIFSRDLIYKLKGLNEQQIIHTLSKLYYKLGVSIFTQNYSTVAKQVSEEIKITKSQIIKKLNTISIIDETVQMSDVAGLEYLKKYINEQKKVFDKQTELNEYNITLPKGIILLGKPGNGKSLAAKAVASQLDLPLIKFDISKILGKYVGESESQMQDTLDIVQAMSPCVLWIDEIEKTFAGINNSENDTMRKILGIFLTWMSDSNKGVFVVATANNIDGTLPPEMVRRGRFDEIFYIDNPNVKERAAIIEIHAKKRNLSIKQLEVNKLAQVSEYLSGAEIEHCCNEVAIQSHLLNDTVTHQFSVLDSFLSEIEKIKATKPRGINNHSDLIDEISRTYTNELTFIEEVRAKHMNKNASALEQLTAKTYEELIATKIEENIKAYRNQSENAERFRLASK